MLQIDSQVYVHTDLFLPLYKIITQKKENLKED